MSKATNQSAGQTKAAKARASQQNLQSPTDETTSRWLLPSCVLIIACAILAYAPSFAGQFTFDDHPNITQNRFLLRPQNAGQTLWYVFGTMRPVVNATILLNYWTTGLDLWAIHAVNLAIHILAGLTLFGLLRRTFAAPRMENRDGSIPMFSARAGLWLSLIIAVLWVVHPLNTQAVTYIIQRTESLAGLFYLLTIYCLARSDKSPHPRCWAVLAVVSCSLGMGCKQIMVTAPIMAALYDKLFLTPTKSFKAMLAKRSGLYLGLAITWLILICLVVIFPAGQSAGSGAELASPLGYLASELGVVAYYLYLAIWPVSLCIDYGWPIASDPLAIILPGLLIAGLLGASAIGLRHGRRIGFAGLWFCIILAPTSTILPIADLAMEHRMYLPLIAVIALAVIGAYSIGNALIRRSSASAGTLRVLGICLASSAVFALGYLTYQRNVLYQDATVLLKDAVAKRPDNFRSRAHLAETLIKTGRVDEGLDYYYQALALAPRNTKLIAAVGMELLKANRPAEAAVQFSKLDNHDVAAQIALANALARMGQWDQAIAIANRAAALARSTNQTTLAGDIESAITKYQRKECLTRPAVPAGTTLPSSAESATSPAK